ncbi:MAG: hypothetical protein Q7I94_03210, partial [Candidatus Contubernalis sp.]|nr:hypothetical protein [Candidatus Contubernalis sp.]
GFSEIGAEATQTIVINLSGKYPHHPVTISFRNILTRSAGRSKIWKVGTLPKQAVQYVHVVAAGLTRVTLPRGIKMS